MAVKKIRMRPEGTNDYGDILHPETSADLVIASDGVTTFESHLAAIATEDTLGHVKLSDIPIYEHPTSEGWKHIPEGGRPGQFLSYGGSSGTARWGNPIPTQYLVDEELNKYIDFVQGYTTSSGHTDIDARPMRLWVTATNLPYATIVTDTTVDLSDFSTVMLKIRPRNNQSSYKGEVTFIVSTNKKGAANSYTKRITSVVEAETTLSLPVNDLMGYYYIRVHVNGNYDGTMPDMEILEWKIVK